MSTTTRTKRTSSKAAQVIETISPKAAEEILVLTTGVDLVDPKTGLTTQRDANVNFDGRITAVETLIDSGTFP